MRFFRDLLSRLPLYSIRSRMLMIALLPALLTEFGMVAYFTTRTLATAEEAVQSRAYNAARHLSDTLPFLLLNGNTARIIVLLEAESEKNKLSFVRITDSSGQLIAHTGGVTHNQSPANYFSQRAEIRFPAADYLSARPTDAPMRASNALLGRVEVGVC